MKNLIYFGTLLIICSGLLLDSCRQYECPDLPVKVTLGGKDFTDVELSSNRPNVASGGVYPIIALLGWTQNSIPFQARSIVKFNYSQIPMGSDIKKATLTLYADTATLYHIYGHTSDVNTGPNNWVIQKITSPWDTSIVTWNNQPYVDAATQMQIAASTSNKQTYVIDLTKFVKEEFENPSKAYGFMMRLVHEAPYNSIMFGATEHGDASLHPKLEIEYMKVKIPEE